MIDPLSEPLTLALGLLRRYLVESANDLAPPYYWDDFMGLGWRVDKNESFLIFCRTSISFSS